jgi:transposase
MGRELVDNTLWAAIEPLLPRPKRRRTHPGRKPLDDRKILTGILFVLMSGIPREMLPKEMGCGSGMTCWRRLRAWEKAGASTTPRDWAHLQAGIADKVILVYNGTRAFPASDKIRVVPVAEILTTAAKW